MARKKTVKKGEWVDPDDAPKLTKEWFERAEIWHGDKLIRPGKPKAEAPKKAKRRIRQKAAKPKAQK